MEKYRKNTEKVQNTQNIFINLSRITEVLTLLR